MNPTAEDPIKLWQHLHGASSHFPIVGMMLAMAFDFGATLFRRPTWRVVGFWTLFAAAVIAVPAVISGLWGQQGWFGVTPALTLNPQSSVLFHRNVALFGAGAAILLSLWRIVRRDALKGGEWAAYLVILLLATGAIGYTGYLGSYIARGY